MKRSTNPHNEMDAGYFYCPYVPLTFTEVISGGFFLGETYYPGTCNIHEVWAKELRKAFIRITVRDPWRVRIKTRYGKAI